MAREKLGRNDPCWCGSGSKYKRCHFPLLANDVARQALQEADPAWLISSLAALQLDVTNLNGLALLEHGVARAAGILDPSGSPRNDRSLDVVGLLDDVNIVGDARTLCDPFNNPVCDEVTFHGGSYRVLPGNSPSAVRAIKDALRLYAIKPDLEGSRTVAALLDLSDWLADLAGWDRRTDHADTPVGTVASPPASELQRRLVLSRDDLAQIVQAGIAHLDPVITKLGNFNPDLDLARETLADRPLVEVDENTYVIALPHELLSAALSVIARSAIEKEVPVAEVFGRSTWTATRDLLRLFFQMPQMPPTPEGILVCPMDMDKVTLAHVVSDDLTGFRSSISDPWMSVPAYAEALEALALRERHFLEQGVEVHQVVVFAPLGRGFMVPGGLPRQASSGSKLTVLTLAELESIVILEAGDPLALWKFARAISPGEIGAPETGPQTVGDVFAVYRRYHHSMYFGDDERPDGVMLPADGDGELRREAQRQRDWHGVLHWDGRHLVEVTTRFGTSAIPIYFAMSKSSEIGAYVETDFPAWVIADAEDMGEHRQLADSLCQTVAYWYWQLSRLPGIRWRRDESHDPLCIAVVAESPEAWTTIDHADEQADVLSTDGDANQGITFRFHLGFVPLMARASNEADRLVVQELLRTVADVDDADAATILEQVAPLGIKKMMLGLTNNRSHHIEADPKGLPMRRLIQEPDTARVMDHLGDYLLTQKGYSVGPLDATRGRRALNDAVAYHLQEIERIYSETSPSRLLETLLAYQESFVHEEARRQYHTPVWLACFGDVDDVRNDTAKELRTFAQSAIALRFLIEVATARPANGDRPLSMSTFDELMAHASEIITRGMTSDELFNGLAKHDISLLASRRLGVLHDPDMASAREDFIDSYTDEELARWEVAFPDIWGPDEPSTDNPEFSQAEWDEAVSAELGVSLAALITVCELLIRVADDDGRPVSVLDRDELVGQLVDHPDATISKTDVELALSQLELGPRDSLLPPSDADHHPWDVFPWRFGRALSLLRRPLVVRRNNDRTEVLWGKRHVSAASRYIVRALSGTRYEAASPELRAAISRERTRKARAFDDAVKAVFTSVGIQAQARVRKLDGALIERSPGQEIGDVDVLAVDAAKKIIWACEAKDFVASGTAHEVAMELKKLLGDDQSPGEVHHHVERTSWLEANRHRLSSHFDVAIDESWVINSVVITSAELMGARVRESPIPIHSIGWLRRQFDATP